jgi:hypothetical protein
MPATTLAEVIETYGIGPNRARLNANFELQRFSIDDVRRILDRLQPLERLKGSSNPCGPVYNRHVGFPLWMRATLWSMVSIGTMFLLPVQIGAAIVLVVRGRFQAIWKELPVPTYELTSWRQDILSFVKAPLELVRLSVENEAALCVNRQGRFSIREKDYAVMSHVWAETMGWQTPTAWGPVSLELRKMGLARAHFLRFFDRCEADWLWADVIAMPEVLEDMSPAQKDEIERLRVGIINCLHSIYTRADKIVAIDTSLLRLSTRSPVDVAVVLCLSFWMTRLWTYTEARLARKVILKTRDFTFDLDTVIGFLGRTVLNDQSRYYALAYRLLHLRDGSLEGYPPTSVMENAYLGGENRYTNVEVDAARALFPLLKLKWEHGWTLTQGLSKIVEAYPEEADWVRKWCEYRRIEFNIPAQNTL